MIRPVRDAIPVVREVGKRVYEFNGNRIRRQLYLASAPYGYSLAVTFRCTSRCATCGIWNAPPEDEMSPETYRRFFEDPIVRKTKYLEFTGGEPTLRKDIIDIMSAAYDNCSKAQVKLGTNCILDDRVIEIADAFKNKGLHVSVSVDGLGPLHDRIRGVKDNFSRVMSVVDHAQALNAKGYPITVGASICVSALNVHDIPALADFLEARRVPFQLTPYIMTRYGQFDRSRLSPIELDFNDPTKRQAVCALFARYEKPTYRQFIRFWMNEDYVKPPCYVLTRGSVSVRPNGDVPICMFRDREYVLGNIVETPFSEIWRSKHVQRLRHKLHNCRQCSFAHPNLCDALNNYDFHGWAYRDYILSHSGSTRLGRAIVRYLLR
jgi:radical SAM protein with 4Fe4S-binding SPASM domain